MVERSLSPARAVGVLAGVACVLAGLLGCEVSSGSDACPACGESQMCISACDDAGPTPRCVFVDSKGLYHLDAADGGVVQACPTF